MNCKKTRHTGCYKKLYIVVSINNGYKHECMLFNTKKEANKVLKELLKAGRIVKRGYDYFTTSLNLELNLNY